jgi:predicted nucleic acid-binding protein
MQVVTNATPLNYLILIDTVDVLPQLFGRILVPAAVMRELTDPRAPSSVRDWATVPPNWAEVRPATFPIDMQLSELDAGEQEAIALALEVNADLLLIDETAGRRKAFLRGIPIAGTLGILGRAAERRLIDLTGAVERLRQTSFRASEALLRQCIDRGSRQDPEESDGSGN